MIIRGPRVQTLERAFYFSIFKMNFFNKIDHDHCFQFIKQNGIVDDVEIPFLGKRETCVRDPSKTTITRKKQIKIFIIFKNQNEI